MNSREQYVEQLKAKLDQWNAQIDGLDAKARKSQAEAKQEFETRLSELKDKRDELQSKLAQMKNASADTWDTLKTGTEVLWEDLKQTLGESKAAFFEGMQEAMQEESEPR